MGTSRPKPPLQSTPNALPRPSPTPSKKKALEDVPLQNAVKKLLPADAGPANEAGGPSYTGATLADQIRQKLLMALFKQAIEQVRTLFAKVAQTLRAVGQGKTPPTPKPAAKSKNPDNVPALTAKLSKMPITRLARMLQKSVALKRLSKLVKKSNKTKNPDVADGAKQLKRLGNAAAQIGKLKNRGKNKDNQTKYVKKFMRASRKLANNPQLQNLNTSPKASPKGGPQVKGLENLMALKKTIAKSGGRRVKINNKKSLPTPKPGGMR